jgi:phosphodiesterase/alkaline phosphatase D-like protein
VIVTEVCGTSITSQYHPQDRVDALRAENPHIKFANTTKQGYIRLESMPACCEVLLRGLDSEKRRDARLETLATFAIEHGRLGALSA